MIAEFLNEKMIACCPFCYKEKIEVFIIVNGKFQERFKLKKLAKRIEKDKTRAQRIRYDFSRKFIDEFGTIPRKNDEYYKNYEKVIEDMRNDRLNEGELTPEESSTSEDSEPLQRKPNEEDDDYEKETEADAGDIVSHAVLNRNENSGIGGGRKKEVK